MKKLFKRVGLLCMALVLCVTSVLASPTPSTVSAAGCQTSGGSSGHTLNRKVGGVSLDQAANFLADMTDITGSYYDHVNDRIVFVGKSETNLPKFDKDDLAVAIKSVIFNGTNPQVNINYAADPSKMDVTYFGGIGATRFGRVLFDADYKLKLYVHGFNPDGQPLASSVPGYKSHFRRFLDKNPDPANVGGGSRFWISPQTMNLKRDVSTSSFVFDQTTMQVQTEPLQANNQWQWNQAATEFAQHQTAYYDQYANESPAYYDAKQLAKIVSVVKWIKDNNIFSDFNWARDYTPRHVDTPSVIDKVVTPQVPHNGYLWRVEGGVAYDKANTYIVDSGFASSMKTASEAASASPEDVHWEFTQNGQTYDSVAVAAEAFMGLGSFGVNVTDMSIPMAGKLDLKVERSYSSLSGSQKGFGRGWDIMPARANNLMPGAIMTCDGGTTYTNFPLRVSIQLSNGLYETFSYTCSNGYTPDKSSYHGKLVRNSNGTYTYTSKDLIKYTFDSNLQFVRQADNNNVGMNYVRGGNGFLTEIVADSGQKLTLEYTYNRLQSVKDWTGREIMYFYNNEGQLLVVLDARTNVAQYTYDSNHRLLTVQDRHQTVVLTNTYHADSRLATQKDTTNNVKTYTYDNTARKITVSDTYGRTDTTKYDKEARTIEQKDALNNTLYYAYTGAEPTPTYITDKRGNSTSNTLDSKGNVTRTQLSDGKILDYEYNANNQLTKIKDGRYGTTPKETTTTYNAAGDPTQKNEAGRITQYEYDPQGDLAATIDARGGRTEWTRDTLGNELTQKNALGHVTTFERDTLGRLTKKIEPSGEYHSYTYDQNNNVLTDTTATGTLTNLYNQENRIYRTIQPDGVETEFYYYTSTSLAAVAPGQDYPTFYGYDAYKNMVVRQNALENQTYYDYDGLDRKTAEFSANNKVSQWEYDQNGNITARVDAQDRRTTYEYDVMNRLKKTTYPNNTTATYAYDDRGNLKQTVDPAGTTNYTYDSFDRLTSMSGPNASNVTYVYDANDNITSIKYPDNKEAKYVYDQANQLRTVTDWNGESTTYQYTKGGQIKSQLLPNNILTRYSYDTAGRLSGLHHTDESSSLAKFSYTRDTNNRVTAKTESLPANVNRYQIYDDALSAGWQNVSAGATVGLADTTSPYRGTKSIKWTNTLSTGKMQLRTTTHVNSQNYQSLSFTAKATNPNQPIKVQAYNSALQVSGTPVNVSAYGGAPDTAGFTKYSIPLSDLITGTDKMVSGVTFLNGATGSQPAIFLDTIEFNSLPSSVPFEKTYSDALFTGWQDGSTNGTRNFSNTTNLFKGLKSLAWTPAAQGALRFNIASGKNTTGYEALTFAIKGSAAGQKMAVQLYGAGQTLLGSPLSLAGYGGNPTTDGYRVYSIPLSDLDGSNKVITGFRIVNELPTAQPMVYVDEMKLVPAEPATIPGATTNYTYDSVGRLLTAAYPGGVNYAYTYDDAGNRLTSDEAGVAKTYTYDVDNQLTAVNATPYTYDDNGNLLNNGTRSFTYDYDNNLKTATTLSNSQTTTYTYDSRGNRIAKNVNGAVTNFVNDTSGDLTQVLATKNGSGSITDYYVYGAGLLSQGGATKADRQYYLDDGLGDVRYVTNHSGSTFASTLAYSPYGVMSGAAGSADFQFRGEVFEPDAGLIYLRARYYNPYTGSFISKDPVPGVLTSPQSQNGYSYAHNDPVNLSDPSGKIVDTIWDILNIGYDIYNCDWGSLAWDIPAAFIPFLPAGVTKLDDVARFASGAGKAANVKFISEQYLKSKNIDAHALKRDFVGSKNMAHYDLYQDTKTGEILIMGKGGKGVPMRTGKFIR